MTFVGLRPRSIVLQSDREESCCHFATRLVVAEARVALRWNYLIWISRDMNDPDIEFPKMNCIGEINRTRRV
jgi:hypothetical protein